MNAGPRERAFIPNEQDLVSFLDEWSGSEAAVRVADGDELVAVFRGRRTHEKRPLFWPIEEGAAAPTEGPGVHLHPGRVDRSNLREGGFVLARVSRC